MAQPAQLTAEREERLLETLRAELEELEGVDLSPEQIASISDVTIRDSLIGLLRPSLYEIHPTTRGINDAQIAALSSKDEIAEMGFDAADLERIVGNSDFLPAEFLVEAARVQASVCRIVFKRFYVDEHGYQFPPGAGWGTGFMVSPTMLLTNNHVIPSAEFASRFLRVEFNYQQDLDGAQREVTTYEFAPGGSFTTDESLDYSLIQLALKSEEDVPRAGDRWGHASLSRAEDSFVYQRMRLNVIQHPNGGPKQVAIRGNHMQGRPKEGFRGRTEEQARQFVLYTSDTLPGSSGAPVFDDSWRLVALHRAGGERDGQTWLNNEGVLLTSIVSDIRQAVSEGVLDESVLVELGL